jgi:hypothetical protein
MSSSEIIKSDLMTLVLVEVERSTRSVVGRRNKIKRKKFKEVERYCSIYTKL